MNMWYKKKILKIPKEGWMTSELWIMNNGVCSAHLAHLIPSSKYDLVGNRTESDDVSNRLIGTAWLDKLIVQVDEQCDTVDSDQLMSSD